MAIRARIISSGNPIQDDLDSLQAVQDIHKEAVTNVVRRIAPQALAEMRHYPRQAVLPFGFETEKSRRWYFAAVNGRIPGVTIPTANGRYRRTNGLARSMFFDAQVRADRVDIVAGSSADMAKHVVGSFDRRRSYQVAGHRRTGWQHLADTVHFWLDAADEEMEEEVASVYVDYRSRRQNR